jgi:hypothetical protein
MKGPEAAPADDAKILLFDSTGSRAASSKMFGTKSQSRRYNALFLRHGIFEESQLTSGHLFHKFAVHR